MGRNAGLLNPTYAARLMHLQHCVTQLMQVLTCTKRHTTSCIHTYAIQASQAVNVHSTQIMTKLDLLQA